MTTEHHNWSEHFVALREDGYSVEDMGEMTNHSTAFVKKHLQKWDDRVKKAKKFVHEMAMCADHYPSDEELDEMTKAIEEGAA